MQRVLLVTLSYKKYFVSKLNFFVTFLEKLETEMKDDWIHTIQVELNMQFKLNSKSIQIQKSIHNSRNLIYRVNKSNSSPPKWHPILSSFSKKKIWTIVEIVSVQRFNQQPMKSNVFIWLGKTLRITKAEWMKKSEIFEDISRITLN